MESGFELVTSDDVAIAGLPGKDITIRAAGRTVGSFGGFVIERSQQRIRYLLVRASGLLEKATLLPFADPRVDVSARAIDLDVDERTLWQLRNFTVDQVMPA